MLPPEQNAPRGGHIPGKERVNYESGDGAVAVRGQFRLPKRRADSHKGDYGKLLIVGGSVGYSGAPNLCAAAAVRAGAGLVRLGVPEPVWPASAVKNSEVMPFPLPADGDGRIAPEALERLRAEAAWADVIAAGPGLGRCEATAALVRWLLGSWRGPLVLDADALWAAAGAEELLDRSAARVVLTPHEGEFARLWPGRSGDRERDARAYAAAHGCALVLKGHRTLAAFPDGALYRIEAGNPGMATGGSGDVLTGVIAAMLGQLDFERAVVTGCWLHARAGDLAAGRLGEYALAASDIIGALPQAELEITETDR